jgi:protein translocase SecG subunit
MSFLIGFLTLVLVVNCLVLILLVLVQLPKKDAGAGIAFGAGTADALFGAGSGNALTKITKYATGILLVLALVLGYMQDKAHKSGSGANFMQQVEQQQMQKPIAPAVAPTTAPAAQTPPANAMPLTTPLGTNAPAK